MKNFYLTALAGLLLVTASHCKSPTEYTKGVGLYPGNPSQDYAPALIIDAKTHRNVAKGRMVYHSSAYDYNLTGQLVADGIFADRSPSYINVSTHLGDLKKGSGNGCLTEKQIPDIRFPATKYTYNWIFTEGFLTLQKCI